MQSQTLRSLGHLTLPALSLLLLSDLGSAQILGQPASAGSLVRIEMTPYEPALETNSGETEGDMNCFELVFARTGLRAIVQNFPDMGTEFAQNQRVLAKGIMREVVLRSGNALNSYHEAGVLYGIEFDWFFPGPMPIVRPNLARTVDVHMVRQGEQGGRFATVYGFREAAYLEHRSAVEDMIGHRMESFVVWEQDVLQTGPAPLRVLGNANRIAGPISAAGSVFLGGRSNSLFGPLQLGGRFQHAEGNLSQVVQSLPVGAPNSTSWNPEALRREALATGTYYPADAEIGASLPPAGLVFAEGSLRVVGDGVRGNWTLVSARGDVELRGDQMRLSPASSGVLAIAFDGDVQLAGNHSLLVGEIHAPQGDLDVSGSSNTLLGAITGAGFTLAGEGNLLTDGTQTLSPSLK